MNFPGGYLYLGGGFGKKFIDMEPRIRELFDKLIHATFEKRDVKKAQPLYEELKKEIKRKKLKKEDRYEFYTELAQRYVMEGMFKQAIKAWGKAYLCAPSKIDKAEILDEIAFCYIQLDKYFLAFLCYKKLFKISKYIKGKESFEYNLKALNGLGEIYSHKKKYNKALKYYSQALKSIDEISNKEEKNFWYHQILLEIFVCYYQLGSYEEAISIYNKINPNYIEKTSKDNYYGFRAHMEYKRKNYEEAIKWYQKAIEACDKIELPDEKLKQLNEKQKEYWTYWLKECERKIKEMG